MMSLWKDNFFQLLPAEHNRGWPDSFKKYVGNTVMAGDNKDPKTGRSLWAKYVSVKGMINSKLNKRFVAPGDLKSGQNVSGMFDATRKAHWEEDIANQKASKRQNRGLYEGKKTGDEGASLFPFTRMVKVIRTSQPSNMSVIHRTTSAWEA